MTQANFQAVMDEVFKHEVGSKWKTGGLVDHPKDPGGLTKWGIAQKAHPELNIRALTRADAEDIYDRDYWLPCAGPRLPPGLDLVAMDGSVNSGVKRGVKWLQRALKVKADGAAGPKTIAAAHAATAQIAIKAACKARMSFLRGLHAFTTFGRGWSRRVAEVEAVAVSMTAAHAPKAAREVLVLESKMASDISKVQKTSTAAPATAAGSVTLSDLPWQAIAAIAALGALAALILWQKSIHNRNRAAAYQRAALKTGL